MNCTSRLIFLVAIAGLMTSAAAWAGESRVGQKAAAFPAFEVCRAIVRISGGGIGVGGPLKVKIYLSDVMPRGPINDEDIRIAFEKFLVGKYGQENANVECGNRNTLATAQQLRDGYFRQNYEGQTFVDTGWKFAPAAKAAAPAPQNYAVCWANRSANVKYYSAVFDGSRDDASRWWQAFQKFLQKKYGFDGPTQCIPPGPRANTEGYLRNLIEQDRKARTMQGAPPKIVQTGWVY